MSQCSSPNHTYIVVTRIRRNFRSLLNCFYQLVQRKLTTPSLARKLHNDLNTFPTVEELEDRREERDGGEVQEEVGGEKGRSKRLLNCKKLQLLDGEG